MTYEPSETFTFDWQAGGGNDKSWRGKARAWTEDKPGGPARSLQSNKQLAIFAPTSYTETGQEFWSEGLPRLSAHEGKEAQTLISSAGDSPAKTSPSPASDEASRASDQASSMNSHAAQNLFDPDGFSSRTFQVSSLHTAVGTSERSLAAWPTSGMAWPGGFSTAVTSACPSDDSGCSSSEPALTEILEPPQSVPDAYSLSARAAAGILRRAQKRGRNLPPHLEAALEATVERET